MAKLKIPTAGKAGHGNTKRHIGLDLLHGPSHTARRKGSGATAKISQHGARGLQEELGLRLPGSLHRDSGG